MTEAPQVAVVLVEYFSGGLVAQRASEADAHGHLPVVADNSGTYEGVGIVVRNPSNRGFGAGCNAAVRAVPEHVQVLVFQNPDACIEPADLGRLVDAVQDGWAAVAPSISADGLRAYGFRVPTPRREVALVLADCLAARGVRVPGFGLRHDRGEEPPSGEGGPVRKPDRFASAALLVMSRRAFESSGGFDEEYFLYAEDLDLWVRLERTHHKVGFLPGAVAQHVSASGSDLATERRVVMRWIGRELFAEKTGRGWRFSRASHLFGWLLLPNRGDLFMRGVLDAMLRSRPRAVQAEVRALMSDQNRPEESTVVRVGWSKKAVRVAPAGLVLDVGSGAYPNDRADVLCERALVREHRVAVVDRPMVVADALALPFRANAFEFVIASHLAEHVEDPRRLGAELSHVARGGYIETPSPLFERLFPTANHRWIVRRSGRAHVTFSPNVRSRAIERLGAMLYPWYFAGTQRERPVIEPRGAGGRVVCASTRLLRAAATRSGVAVTRVVFSEREPLNVRID